MSENKDRLTYRPEPETRQKIEQWYEADNCRSMNEFIDKAVSFYADWLSANRNDMLPRAISSAMDGRLKILEKNLSSLSFNHAVELDMLMGISLLRPFPAGFMATIWSSCILITSSLRSLMQKRHAAISAIMP